MEVRNIGVFLLKKRVLSRRNCSRAAGAAEVEFRPPRGERGKRDIEEAALEHEQEWYREELSVDDCEPDKVTEINGKCHFRNRQERFERSVFASAPGLRFALDAILWCAGKIGVMVEDSFEDGARVVERQADAERK
jgi:hypothetical protein